jgi:hypothetical protein
MRLYLFIEIFFPILITSLILGWASVHLLDCEADILAECASLVQCEEGRVVSKKATELFELALGIFPGHVRSNLSLCHIELAKFKALNPISIDSSVESSKPPFHQHPMSTITR